MKTIVYAFLFALMALSLSRGPSEIAACGGPEVAALRVLQPVERTVDQMAHPDPIWAAWGNFEREELRFLYPFHREDPAHLEPLWKFSHEGLREVPPPPSQALDAALAAGDWARAAARAQDVVDAWMAMPPVLAAPHRAVMDRAVSVVELAPQLSSLPRDAVDDYFGGRDRASWPPPLARAVAVRAGDPAAPVTGHPRAPTAQWRAMNRDFSATVPDGWASATRANVGAATWTRLLRDAERWLAAHPGHPLADLVRLHQVRIHYFGGTTDEAWEVAIDLLSRRKVRALAEMRYLLVQGDPPSAAQIERLQHPTLIAALASGDRITGARWVRWWQLSEKDPAAAWSQNLQERLLFWAARHAVLPSGFPAERAPPTPLWGKLRAAALMQVGKTKEALSQLARLPADDERALLEGQARVARGEIVQAAQIDALEEDSRRYLVEVLMDDAQLQSLEKHAPAHAATRLERAIRLTAAGRWEAAAKLVERGDGARATLWRQAGALEADPASDAPVKLAQLFVEHRRELFHPPDPGWYRALSDRHAALQRRGGTTERKKIEAYLTRSSPRWRAFVELADWLATHPHDPDAKRALALADDQYNRLLYYGGYNEFFWGRFTRTAPEVAVVRRVGKIVRATP